MNLARHFIALLFLFICAGCTSATRREEPWFVQSSVELPNGSTEVVVWAWAVKRDGSTPGHVDMGALFEKAADELCPGGYVTEGEREMGMITPKSGGLKMTMKGVVKCKT